MPKNTFLEGKILPPLIKFALPLMFSQLLQALYGAVDLIVVGKYSSTAQFSAVATASQLIQGVTGIIIGLATGVTVLIAHAIGANKKDIAGQVTAGIIKILSVLSILFFILLWFLAEPALKLLQIPNVALKYGVDYVRVCAMGTAFIAAYNVISGIFRGLGNSKMPLIFIIIACIVNIIGDLILVGIFGLGAAGAAIATVLAQAISVVFSLLYMTGGRLPFTVTKDSFKGKDSVVKILKIGTPIALQDFLTKISFLILTAILNSLGLIASASIGISEKLFLFLSIIPFAFMSALSAFVAQNMGAGKPERAKSALNIAVAVSFSVGVIMFILTFFFPEMLASIFEKSPEVIAAAARYQRGCSFEHLLIAIYFCQLGYFNGIGKTNFVLVQGIITSFAVRIPISYILSRGNTPDLFNIGLAVPLSALFCLILCCGYMVYLNKKTKNLNKSQT